MKVGDKVICIQNHVSNFTGISCESKVEIIQVLQNGGVDVKWEIVDYPSYYPEHNIKKFMKIIDENVEFLNGENKMTEQEIKDRLINPKSIRGIKQGRE